MDSDPVTPKMNNARSEDPAAVEKYEPEGELEWPEVQGLLFLASCSVTVIWPAVPAELSFTLMCRPTDPLNAGAALPFVEDALHWVSRSRRNSSGRGRQVASGVRSMS